MPERRQGKSIFWEAFWKHIYGERRQGDRRSKVNAIVFEGCGGSCYQGRRECDCKPRKEDAP